MSGKQPMLCLLPSFAFNVEVRELAEKGTVKGKVIHKLHTNKRKCRTRHETFGHDGNALKSDNSDACTTLNILKPTVLYTLKG